ncbi:hypothetical protein, partial [Microcoleus sp. POL10_C6]|uniref:hypothetical protein n=1 Tax=Microcoleus sp. POL10_C6 TaxID=2818852 RepID=UPI002FD2F03B
GVTGTLNAYPTYIIAYLSLIYCLSPVNGRLSHSTINLTGETPVSQLMQMISCCAFNFHNPLRCLCVQVMLNQL